MDRKQIVKILEKHFEVKSEYLGAPSFAYQVETEDETYTIDREGKIITTAAEEVKLEELLSGPEPKEDDDQVEQPKEAAAEAETLDLEVKLPMEGHSGRTLRNLVNMIYSKQSLIKKAFRLEDNIVEEDFSIGINEVQIETLEDFKTALEDIGENSCLGIEFDFFENTTTFKLLKDADADEIKAATDFIALLNENAKNQKYASAKVKPTDNEKYTFRTWLLRLGMIGDEYKLARKVLLQNLSGNGAFRKPKKESENHEA
jgi:hypothetical protein